MLKCTGNNLRRTLIGVLFVLTTIASTASPCGDATDPEIRNVALTFHRRAALDIPKWTYDSQYLIFGYLGTIVRYDLQEKDFIKSSIDIENETYLFSPSLSATDDVAYKALVFCDSDSIDRKSFCFSSIGHTVLKIMRTDGTDDDEVLTVDSLGQLAWSPNNNDIAFTGQPHGSYFDIDTGKLGIVSRDGSNVTFYDETISACAFYSHRDQAVYCLPEWSSSGSHIAVIVSQNLPETDHRSWSLVVVDIESETVDPIVELHSSKLWDNINEDLNESLGEALDWSWVDDRIYFVKYQRYNDETATFAGNTWTSSIYSINPDGSDLRMIYQADPGLEIDMIEVSPDGSQMLFVMNTYDGLSMPSLNLINIDSSNHRGVRHFFGAIRASWSPDGSEIAMISRPKIDGFLKHEGLFVMNADGKNIRYLLELNYETTVAGDIRDVQVKKVNGRLDLLPETSLMETVENE